MTSALSELIAQEVEKTLGRLRSKIVEAADIEDDFEIDLSKFAQNTAKKVVSSEAFTEMVGQITSAVEKEAEKKDPDAPKGAKNAFIFFCNEKRQEVKEENASLKATEITKKLGEMWKEEEDEEKKRYQKMAEDDKKRYAEEIAEYEPKDGFKNPKSPKKSKKVKSTAPKRALSAYLFFCQATREDIKKKNPSIKSSEILSELGKMWKALSEKKRKPFDKLAEEDKKRYEEEMKEYVPTEEEKDAMEAKKKGKKGASKVSKRSPTAYLLFCNEKREEVKNANKDKKTTEITSILGNMWTNLSENKKKPYEEKAAKLKEAFDSENEEKNEQEAEKKVTKKMEKNEDEKKVTKKVEKNEAEKKVTKKVTKKTEKNDDEKKVTKKVEKKVEVVEEEEVEEEEEDDEEDEDETILEDDDEDDE